jgi:hypothetical protein
MTYYNTTNESGDFLKRNRIASETQDAKILEMFKSNADLVHSAENMQVLAGINGFNWPLTSVRRSLNTLMKEGFIEQAGQQIGSYGRKIFTYKLKNNA